MLMSSARRYRGVDREKSSTAVCACCHTREDIEWDHIIPRSKGGSDARRNLQYLCRRCNVSKGVGSSCTIIHTLDVMLTNTDMAQDDTPNADEKNVRQVRSKPRLITGPNPQVNWRVDERVKQEIEEQARRRGIGAGEIIKELWRSQHAEILHVLQDILVTVQHQTPTPPSVLPDPMVQPSPPFAHRDPSQWPTETPRQDRPSPSPVRSRTSRLWHWCKGY